MGKKQVWWRFCIKTWVMAFLHYHTGDMDIPLILLAGSPADRDEARVMAVLHHNLDDLNIPWYFWLIRQKGRSRPEGISTTPCYPAGSTVGWNKSGVIAFLNHPVGDLDIPLILLAQEAGVMAILHHHVGDLDILWYCWLNCPIG
jgi:hypothetical protein